MRIKVKRENLIFKVIPVKEAGNSFHHIISVSSTFVTDLRDEYCHFFTTDAIIITSYKFSNIGKQVMVILYI